jgi:hypothetical protein
MDLDTSRWSGEGDFTRTLLDALASLDGVALVRVEDAPASRAETGYAFLANEVYVAFARRTRTERFTWLGLVPRTRRIDEPALTIEGLAAALARVEGVGPADYADEGMIQYLRTERIVPPYQTKGYKLVELVRVYAGGASRR